VSKDVPHCSFLRFEVKNSCLRLGRSKKKTLLLSMQWHERSDQHHNDRHWSHANKCLSRRVLCSTMATRLRRRGTPLLVQSHNSWVDLGRPSFWITLQISQFMVRSSFPFFDPPLFDNPMAADLFPTIPAIMRRVHVWAHAGRPGGHSNGVCRQGADGIPPMPRPNVVPRKVAGLFLAQP
jgi:hypothetical protein